ncbi:hypothetical protein D3C76_1127820 [compost metagenome]
MSTGRNAPPLFRIPNIAAIRSLLLFNENATTSLGLIPQEMSLFAIILAFVSNSS